ncbi:cleft lip and palate transmembrane 1 [Cadophora sp. DSE1049]|nr:cleft lip and palate transmembrane 1 [Cadophora sp. DSE1049]
MSGAAPPAARAQAQEGGMGPMVKSAVQGLAIFFGMQFVMGKVMGPKTPAAVTTTDASGATITVPANTAAIPPFNDRPNTLDEGALYNPIAQRIAPMWPLNSPLDITVIISPTFVAEPISKAPQERIVVNEKGFVLGSFEENRVIDTSFAVPNEVQNNGTLWAHFYVALKGANLDPVVQGYDPTKAYHFTRPLTQYITQKKVKKVKNLLAAEETEEEEEELPTGPVINSHYHPNFTLSFIPDSGVMHYPTMNPAVRQYVQLEASGARDGSGQNGWYYPVLFVNTFWQLRTHMMPVNSTVKRLPIHIDLNHQANWKFSLIAGVDEGVKQTARNAAAGQTMGGDGSEFEMIKEVLLDTNIYLLATTVVVSVFHMIFEMLAFKSDISHYRNKKNNVGISVRSILGNVFMQAVIFLYLLDNNDNTSWMILFSQGMGIVLEFWKITTVVNVRVRPAPDSIIPYRIAFEDKHELSETEEKTKEYDAVAFKYLYMIAVPLLLAYAAYSLKYDSHKSWYSFVITTLVGSVYAYGFLMMVPSLYINYRLKSVAHMPAKAMTYKFLNTFIDDLFAFTIKMPTLHRLATLRDDVIFFVYLYQSYKYKVDYTRVNEFGQGGDEEELEAKMAAKPLSAPADADASVEVGKEGAKKADEIVSEVAAKVSGSEKKGGKASKRK